MGLIACHYRAAEWRHKEIEGTGFPELTEASVPVEGAWPLGFRPSRCGSGVCPPWCTETGISLERPRPWLR
jgi:hypothetical protein